MDPQNREPLTEEIKEVIKDENNKPEEKTGPTPAPVYAERAETSMPTLDPEEMKALALSYARYLAEHDMAPGEPTFTDSDEVVLPDVKDPDIQNQEEVSSEAAEKEEAQKEVQESNQEETEPEKQSDSEKSEPSEESNSADSNKKPSKPAREKRKLFAAAEPTEEQIAALEASLEKRQSGSAGIGNILDLHDRAQAALDRTARNAGISFARALHKITATYRQSRRIIGLAILIIGILAAVVLAVFDRFTVYEYAYNGKTLGYVRNQEDVTDVLDIAGTMLTANSSGETEIRFIANQNVTFKQVDARGKSTDDADTAVNKLVYMTDIETEAFGVYDGNSLVAVVKSNEDAENLLNQTRDYLSEPDEGMTLVSADFMNDLGIKPINVLLTSVQSNADAMTMMTEGGKMEIYHIVEEGENLASLSETFGVEEISIFDENNKELAEEIVQGDKVCIHEEVEPVKVKMVETGKMKEIIEYETVKKESDDYYKGDTYTKQEGVDGVQIFEGTLTKEAGEVTDRDGSTEVIKKKKDKIILVGTAERPKTAPTGTFAMPIHSYTLTSRFGYRWGRLHSGVDLAAPTGTPIFAADGGTIQRAGWYAGYGLCVEVYHENGRMTRYGHCSQLLVNVGDKVYQGQNIALVGNTGHSFGSHLHFEININGSPVNPAPYLGL